MNLKKYTILAGNYGSGKTEISLNLALAARAEGKQTTLLDMDIVNPYFRSSEQEALLEEKGIRVIKPCFANTAVDVPSLPADVYAPFDAPVDCAVFDAGGDPVGAAALGILAERFWQHDGETEFWYIVNPMRPLQETPELVIEMLRQIEARSRVRVTHLVNNANLAADTTIDVVRSGLEIVKEVSRQTEIPIRFTTLRKDLAGEWRQEQYGKCLPIDIYMRPDWLDSTC